MNKILWVGLILAAANAQAVPPKVDIPSVIQIHPKECKDGTIMDAYNEIVCREDHYANPNQD